ncbi:hypothetical protein [Zongyangia hominis]|uniref:Uncharacterized protein n=1 Tax=Zongyangia hominis TaxID=2763677 RepID=A0A926EA58_9FIRM|nr:hypothetical protein [Zongyangia hominis]MBC8569230.1 hypothetical protein [Zongyangia hominis]
MLLCLLPLLIIGIVGLAVLAFSTPKATPILSPSGISLLRWEDASPVQITTPGQSVTTVLQVGPEFFEPGNILLESGDTTVATVEIASHTSDELEVKIVAAGQGSTRVIASSSDGLVKSVPLDVIVTTGAVSNGTGGGNQPPQKDKPATTTPVTTTPPTTTKPPVTTTTAGRMSEKNAIAESILSQMRPIVEQSFQYYSNLYFDASNDTIVIEVAYEGISDAIKVTKAIRQPELLQAWHTTCDKFLYLSSTTRDAMNRKGGNDLNLDITILDDINFEDILLKIYNGSITYDAMAE